MSWDNNIYSNPEKHGLKVVAELEYSDLDYQFDTRIVWRSEKTGILYTARDMGCSCPAPFEEYNTLESLEQLVSLDTLRDEYQGGKSEHTEYGWHYPSSEEWTRFSRAVRDAFKRP